MHLYSAILCIVVHPKHFTVMGGAPQPPPPVVMLGYVILGYVILGYVMLGCIYVVLYKS